MLFNSYVFIFAFLPASLLGFYVAASCQPRLARGWLVACSLFFYGWWNPHFIGLLLGSVGFNYAITWSIQSMTSERWRRGLLAGGIVGNLLLLLFYKYLFALLAFCGLADLPALDWTARIVLPLGISFFTFTQIGYLVDCSQGLVKRPSLVDYLLFVTFFPHLIAGPILHNREMLPQFADPKTYRLQLDNLAIGLSIFVIGLGKKVIIADPLAVAADAGFAAPHLLSAASAWQASLSYALQLYFDFSGYSDMAIGIARMFGILFPLNFNSPYRSRCIIDFWQRWHMTLTRYLTLYLFNPMALWIARRRAARGLDSTRKAARSLGGFAALFLLPVFFTMTLAGIWHGAGLQFLIFGLLHAAYLSINHAWRIFGGKRKPPGLIVTAASITLTFLAVLVGQIFFRAHSPAYAVSMLRGMVGLHPAASRLAVPAELLTWLHKASGWQAPALFVPVGDATELKQWLRIASGFAIVWCLPNTQQIMVGFRPALEAVRPFPLPALRWHPSVRWGLAIGALLIAGLYNLDNPSRFLYFQF